MFAFLALVVFFLVVAAIIAVLGVSLDPTNPTFGPAGVIGIVFFAIAYIIAIFFFGIVSLGMVAATVRRLHDRNISGWWYLAYMFLSAIPFVNLAVFVVLIIVLCLKGNDGVNKYGADPLGNTDADVFQ